MTSLIMNDLLKDFETFQNSKDDLARQRVLVAAEKLINELETPIEKLARIGWGEPTRTAALRTAIEMGLLAKLGQKPISCTELAEQTQASPDLISRTLKHLAAHNIVKETGKDEYSGTIFSMAANDPAIAGGLTYSFEAMIPIFNGFPELLAERGYQVPTDGNDGPFQYGLKTNKTFFGLLEENARLANAFNNFMTGYSTNRPRWVEFYPCKERLSGALPQKPLLVDVGGGLGHDISAFHNSFPTWTGDLILEDTPTVVSQIRQSSTLPVGINAVEHDFFTPQPLGSQGASAYFLRQILHDWPDEKCTVILSHIRDAMVAGHSKLLINENVVLDTDAPWQQTSLDWTMMCMLVSRERTESQWKALLATAGLKLTKIWQRDPGSESVIEAVLMQD